MNDDRGDYWTTWGSVRGTCGHRHRSPETAERCRQRDRRAVRRCYPSVFPERAYSDRQVYRMPVDAEPAEADRRGERVEVDP